MTILAGNVTTLADVGDVQGNVEQAHQAHPPGEGEVRLADAGAVPEEPGPTRGVSSTDAGGTVGRTSVSGDVANVSELAAEAAGHDAEEREALAAPSTWMASEGSRTDGQVMDDLQDAEAQQEAEEAQAIAASGVGSHGDVADVADMADIADDELQADEEAADKGASGVASHGDVADIADVADLLEDEAEAEAEETADARSDAVKFDVGDVADLLEEVESKAGSYSDGAGVASDIADLDVADLEDVYEALDSQDFSEQVAILYYYGSTHLFVTLPILTMAILTMTLLIGAGGGGPGRQGAAATG